MGNRVRELFGGSRAKAIVLSGVFAVAVLTGSVAVIAWGNNPTGAAEVFLEPANSVGRNPFADFLVLPVPSILPALDLLTGDGDGIKSLRGDQVGLYGGTRNDQVCDREQLIRFLGENPDKGAAWAGVQGIKPADIPGYIRSLTPLQLRVDTRVTNHGFADGVATPLQSVLQAGTAVLVDRSGVPRARCACGNPLLPPEAQAAKVSYKGEPWAGFDTSNLRRIVGGGPVTEFVVHDARTNTLFVRPVGTAGEADRDPSPGTKMVTTTTTSTTAGPGGPASTGSSGSTTTLVGQRQDGSTTTGTGPDAKVTTTTSTTNPGISPASTSTTATTSGGSVSPTTPTDPTSPVTPPTTVTTDSTTTSSTTSSTSTPTTPPTVPKVRVPEVRKQNEQTALAVLKRVGLNGSVKFVTVAGAAPGVVVDQDPLPDTVVDEGSTVTLTVAQAPRFILVPDTAGRTVPEAQKQIEGVGLVFKGNDAGINQSLPCNSTLVRGSDPAAKTEVQPGTTVVVTFIRGLPCRGQ